MLKYALYSNDNKTEEAYRQTMVEGFEHEDNYEKVNTYLQNLVSHYWGEDGDIKADVLFREMQEIDYEYGLELDLSKETWGRVLDNMEEMNDGESLSSIWSQVSEEEYKKKVEEWEMNKEYIKGFSNRKDFEVVDTLDLTDKIKDGVVFKDPRIDDYLRKNEDKYLLLVDNGIAKFGKAGDEGRELEVLEHEGRAFGVTAKFPEDNPDKVNKYLEIHKDESLLAIKDGECFIARTSDKGDPLQKYLVTFGSAPSQYIEGKPSMNRAVIVQGATEGEAREKVFNSFISDKFSTTRPFSWKEKLEKLGVTQFDTLDEVIAKQEKFLNPNTQKKEESIQADSDIQRDEKNSVVVRVYQKNEFGGGETSKENFRQENFSEVARLFYPIEAKNPNSEEVSEILNQAYTDTNSIETSWVDDMNREGKAFNDCQVVGDAKDKNKCRSTSVGDVVMVDEVVYGVASVGFNKIGNVRDLIVKDSPSNLYDKNFIITDTQKEALVIGASNFLDKMGVGAEEGIMSTSYDFIDPEAVSIDRLLMYAQMGGTDIQKVMYDSPRNDMTEQNILNVAVTKERNDIALYSASWNEIESEGRVNIAIAKEEVADAKMEDMKSIIQEYLQSNGVTVSSLDIDKITDEKQIKVYVDPVNGEAINKAGEPMLISPTLKDSVIKEFAIKAEAEMNKVPQVAEKLREAILKKSEGSNKKAKVSAEKPKPTPAK